MAPLVTPNEKTEQQELVDQLDDANLHLTFAWRDQPDKWRVEIAPALGSLTDELLELAKNTASDLNDNRAEVTYDPEWPLNETQFFGLPNASNGHHPKLSSGVTSFRRSTTSANSAYMAPPTGENQTRNST
jgi:hypothetical protein